MKAEVNPVVVLTLRTNSSPCLLRTDAQQAESRLSLAILAGSHFWEQAENIVFLNARIAQ
jgi:hypothetical protein